MCRMWDRGTWDPACAPPQISICPASLVELNPVCRGSTRTLKSFLSRASSVTSPQSRYNSGVPFRIRQFEKSDFDTLWQIDQACFDPQLAYSRPEMAFYMRRPGSFTLVADSLVAETSLADTLVARAANGESPRTGKANGKTPTSSPDSRVLGFIVAETRRKIGHIITIDVIAGARRAGVGSALLHAAEERLLRTGAAAVALETPVNNAAAIRFYKQKGYFVEKTIGGYYSNQMDALVMTKELTP